MLHTYLLGRLSRFWAGLLLCFLLAGSAEAQSTGGAGQRYTLRGRVTDAGGLGLPGATVLLSGTNFGASANADGKQKQKQPVVFFHWKWWR